MTRGATYGLPGLQMFQSTWNSLTGVPIQTTTMIPDGELRICYPISNPTFLLGVHPENSPTVIARKLVREGLRDVLAWLDHPPRYLTGREVLDKLAGRPVWSPHRSEP